MGSVFNATKLANIMPTANPSPIFLPPLPHCCHPAMTAAPQITPEIVTLKVPFFARNITFEGIPTNHRTILPHFTE
jgi:hypothetical protein